MHYKRLRSKGDVNFTWRAPAEVRFTRHFTAGSPDECWEWMSGRDKNGYGCFAASKGVLTRAHRFAWEYASGESIPAGMCVCHACDNPPCVNPAHLFLDTHAGNSADKVRKGRQRGNQTGTLGDLRRRLTEDQVAAIRSFGHPYYGAKADLARKYGISAEHVRRIQNGTRR